METLNLSKRYGKTDALRGLNFEVEEGEIMVILGPNGSGETTLPIILITILKPTSGTARVIGLNVAKVGTKVREVKGIAFQDRRILGDPDGHAWNKWTRLEILLEVRPIFSALSTSHGFQVLYLSFLQKITFCD